MPTILIILLVLVLLGGGGGYWASTNWGPTGGVSVVGIVIIVCVLLFLFGGLRG